MQRLILGKVLDNHQNVSPADYSAGKVQLPHPDEVPNVDMQVVNYHRPIFGTFHAKFMVVDRKIAIIGSNNIQVLPHALSTNAKMLKC
jgi:hypothetical protein